MEKSNVLKNVVKYVKNTLEIIWQTLIAKANVDFAPFAMPLLKLLSPDADTARMVFKLVRILANLDSQFVPLVLDAAINPNMINQNII